MRLRSPRHLSISAKSSPSCWWSSEYEWLTLCKSSLDSSAGNQGLTLVDFSAQRKHFLWDRGCI